MREHGLNTPDCILIHPDKGLTDDDVRYIHSHWALQMRSFRYEKEGGHPIFLKITPEECVDEIKKLQEQGFFCIPGPSIPVEERLFSGACWKRDEEEPIIVETVKESTPRKITRENIVEKRYVNSEPNTKDDHVNRIIDLVKQFPVNNVVLEFTCSRNPVGWKNENVLFWEIVDDGLVEQRFAKRLSDNL
jgi:hypothetical protein